ncbi:carboxypeptidase regulatory-like domain-containing protein [Candidatus Saganbacteria bacterium]|nr:carboxypeptidase regulatory-like domain-containing protein [Candidatus Saganbacteria bacterium]
MLGFFLLGCGVDQGVKTISVSSSSKTIGLNKTQQFYAYAFDASNATVSKTFTWGVEGSIGTIDAAGFFYAGASPGSGSISASVDGVTGKSTVVVTTKGTITGKIINQAGDRISDVIITASSLSATSNTSGDYSINGVAYGTFEVKTRENILYLSATTEAFVLTGESTTANITLNDRFSVKNENISGNPITISGKVQNNGTTEAAGVSIMYSFYDADGNLSSSATRNLGNISAQSSSSFNLSPTPIISAYSRVAKTVSAAGF